MISYRKSLGQSSLTADGLALEDDGGFLFEFDVSSKHDRATALDGGLIRLGRGVCFKHTGTLVLALIDLSVLLSIATDRCFV